MRACPHCGQSLAGVRYGIRFPQLKICIIDAIARAGENGIDADDLFGLIYDNPSMSRRTLKAHVWQINDMLASAGVVINGTRGSGRRYTLKRRRGRP